MGNRERLSGKIKCTFPSLGSTCLERNSEVQALCLFFSCELSLCKETNFFIRNYSPLKSVFRNNVMDISNFLSWWTMGVCQVEEQSYGNQLGSQQEGNIGVNEIV